MRVSTLFFVPFFALSTYLLFALTSLLITGQWSLNVPSPPRAMIWKSMRVVGVLLFTLCLASAPRTACGSGLFPRHRRSATGSGGGSSSGSSSNGHKKSGPPHQALPYHNLSRKLTKLSSTAGKPAGSPPMPTTNQDKGRDAECARFDSYDSLIEAGHNVGRSEGQHPVALSSPVKLSMFFHDTPEKVAKALSLFTCAARLEPTR